MELTSSFRYLSPAARLYAGVDALSNLGREAERLDAKRAFIVCSETVARTTNLLERTQAELGDAYAGSYEGAKRESPIPLVMAGVEAAKAAQADMIVAVGGGSAVVTARAITILMAENGTPQELCTKYAPGQPPFSPRLMQPKVPNVLVLTTPTNGANRGGAAVLDDKPPYRLELFDPKARPASIILDGEALLTAPLPLFLDTAANTFTAVVGGLQSPNLNPFAYADLRQALELSLDYLPRLVADPDDLKPRIQLGAAAIISNRAADAPSAGIRGVATTLDRQIRYRYSHVGQGASNAVLLTTAMRRNREVALEGQARLADLMGVRKSGSSDAEAAEEATQAVDSFLRSIGVASRIRDLDVPEADLEAIARDDAAQPSFGEASRRITDVAELTRFLQEAW